MGNQTPHTQPQVTDTDEEKIARLLSALPRVDAPGNFAFRVKAGIAKGKPSTGTQNWLPTTAKAALPLALTVLVGGYFAVTALYRDGDVQTPVVSRQEVPSAPAQEQRPPERVIEQNAKPVVTAQVPPAVDQQPISAEPVRTIAVSQPSVKKRNPTASYEGSRSTDAGALITKELSKTPGTAATPDTSPKGERAGEVLTRLGVNALFGESGWKAESISPNTAAAKAGIKAGDVIEAVDDQTMTDLGSVAKPAKGKKLRVLREGKSIDVVIDP